MGSKGWAGRAGVRSENGNGRGLGETVRKFGRARIAGLTRLVDCLSCAAVSPRGRRLRPATNSQLRTGTDQGNPTV